MIGLPLQATGNMNLGQSRCNFPSSPQKTDDILHSYLPITATSPNGHFLLSLSWPFGRSSSVSRLSLDLSSLLQSKLEVLKERMSESELNQVRYS